MFDMRFRLFRFQCWRQERPCELAEIGEGDDSRDDPSLLKLDLMQVETRG